MLELLGRRRTNVTWVVLSGAAARGQEARKSARRFLAAARQRRIIVEQFRDGYFPHQQAAIKDFFERLKGDVQPDLILSHAANDLHQDHRLVAELTWNTFRDHLILEYEIPKWDGDISTPNLYVPVAAALMRRKVDLLISHFGSQRSKHWFDAETFLGLARLRGMECRADDRYAEAFTARKLPLV